MDEARQQRLVLVLRVVGAGLLTTAAAIHLDLYVTGYRTIPTIGGLFLFQVIVAFALAAIVLVSGSRLAAAAGALVALSTLGGYLLSLRVSLFGFREVRTTAGIVAGTVEAAAFAALALLALMPGASKAAATSPEGRLLQDRLQAGLPSARLAVAVLSALALAVLGVSVAATGPTSTNTSTSSSGALLKVTTIRQARLLTNAHGFTLYWFAPDSSTRSTCYGTCAAVLATGDRYPDGGPGGDGQAGHDHAVGRDDAGHLQRASPLHLRR